MGSDHEKEFLRLPSSNLALKVNEFRIQDPLELHPLAHDLQVTACEAGIRVEAQRHRHLRRIFRWQGRKTLAM